MEKLKVLLNSLREKVKNYFSSDASGHNIDHLERTLNYALYLQSKEGGDKIVIGISAFIHDIHRIMGAEQKRFVSPKESLATVWEFIKDLDITQQQKEHILYAIEHHEEYGFSDGGVQVSDIESKILQDADNLDAIGAIGLYRTINYGAAHNVKIYEPSVPLYTRPFNEGEFDESTIHHINNKLLRLGDYMNTQSAKQLAMQKNKIMRDFMEMFIKEYTGKFD